MADFEDHLVLCCICKNGTLPSSTLCVWTLLIPTQCNTHAVHLVGRLCTTHKKMKAYFVKKAVEPGVSGEVKN